MALDFVVGDAIFFSFFVIFNLVEVNIFLLVLLSLQI